MGLSVVSGLGGAGLSRIAGLGGAGLAASGSGPAPVGKLQNVVTFTPLPCTTASPSSTMTGFLCQWPFQIAVRTTHLVFSYSKVQFKTGGYAVVGTGAQDQTFHKVAVALYPATSAVAAPAYSMVKFSAAAGFVLTAGDIDFQCDVFSIQDAFGIPYLDVGDIFWYRQRFHLAGANNAPAIQTTLHRAAAVDTPINLVYEVGVDTVTVDVDSTSNVATSGGSDRDPGFLPTVLGYTSGGVEPVSILAFGGQGLSRFDATQEGAVLNYASKACETAILPYGQFGFAQEAVANSWYSGNDLLWLSTFGRYFNTLLYAMGEDDTGSSTPALRETAKLAIMEYARTTLQMQIIGQNVMPSSTGSWTTDPAANQDVSGALAVDASAADTLVDTDYANNIFDYQQALTNIADATTRRKWSVVTFGGVAAPFTGATGPLGAAGAGREPISLNVHNLVIAPPFATLLSTFAVRWVIDLQGFASVGTTVATPMFRTNGDDGTVYFILIPSTDVAAFDAQTETQQGDDIIAGTQSGGSAATNAQNLAVSSHVTTSRSLTQITGLSINTVYKGYWIHVNTALTRSRVYKFAFTTSNGSALVNTSQVVNNSGTTTPTTPTITPTQPVSGYLIFVFRPSATTVSQITVGGMSLIDATIELVDTQSAASRNIAVYQTTASPVNQGPTTCTATVSTSANVSVFAVAISYGTPADVIRIADLVKSNGTGTALSATATNIVSTDLVLAGIHYAFGGGAATEGTNETELFNFENSAANSSGAYSQSGASGGVMAPTIAVSAAWAEIAFPCPAAA